MKELRISTNALSLLCMILLEAKERGDWEGERKLFPGLLRKKQEAFE